MSRTLLLWAFFVALPVAAARPAMSPAAVQEVRQRADAPLIVDVRTPEEFAAGHIPGAVLIPHDQVGEHLAEFRDAKWVVLYCRSGRRAGIAETLLQKEGIEVRQMHGSWLAWEAQGLPVARGRGR